MLKDMCQNWLDEQVQNPAFGASFEKNIIANAGSLPRLPATSHCCSIPEGACALPAPVEIVIAASIAVTCTPGT